MDDVLGLGVCGEKHTTGLVPFPSEVVLLVLPAGRGRRHPGPALGAFSLCSLAFPSCMRIA